MTGIRFIPTVHEQGAAHMADGCGPLGYRGSKAAMKLIAQADVVLALGTRLGASKADQAS